MRICIFGAGASGGHFAVRLAEAGHDIAVLARGEQLAAIRDRGLTLLEGDHTHTVHVHASEAPDSLGVQDFVLVTVKAPALGAVAERLAPLIGPQTLVVFAQNGMPWWYPHGLPADRPAPPELPIFRLAERFLAILPAERVLGGLIYSANEVIAPGVIRNTSPGRNRLDIGSIAANDGAAEELRGLLRPAHIASPAIASVRQAVWHKLLVNVSGSTIALVTGNKSSVSRTDALLGAVYLRVLGEAMAVSAAHGYPLDELIDPAALHAQLNDHKPSLLQDYERGRVMEIAEIILAPLEFARMAGVQVPTLEALAAVARRLSIDRGLYRPDLASERG